MTHDARLVEAVARALDPDAWRPMPYTMMWQIDRQDAARRNALAALDAINASDIAWVAPRMPTAAMLLPFAHGMHEQLGDWIVMRDFYLAEQTEKPPATPTGGS